MTERRGAQDEPDAGRQFAEGGGGRGDCGAHPDRGCGDSGGPGAAGDRGAGLFLRGPEFAQQATCALDGGGTERRRADARRDALEQPTAEVRLEPGDGTGERRLGDGETLGGGAEPAGLGDRDQPDELAAGLEQRGAQQTVLIGQPIALAQPRVGRIVGRHDPSAPVEVDDTRRDAVEGFDRRGARGFRVGRRLPRPHEPDTIARSVCSRTRTPGN